MGDAEFVECGGIPPPQMQAGTAGEPLDAITLTTARAAPMMGLGEEPWAMPLT